MKCFAGSQKVRSFVSSVFKGSLAGWEILLAVPLNQDLYVDHTCIEITGIGAHCPITLQEL
jgi:hypothetical protein